MGATIATMRMLRGEVRSCVYMVVAAAAIGCGGAEPTGDVGAGGMTGRKNPGAGGSSGGKTGGGAGGESGAGAAGGESGAGGDPGAGAAGGEGGAGGTPECTGSDKRCNGVHQEVCDAGGTWKQTMTCPFACTSGDCTGECENGKKTCNGNVPAACEGNTWKNGQACQFLCSNGDCAGACVPTSRQCSGNVAQTCDSNGAWQNLQGCSYVCRDGVCGGVCTPNAKQCNGLVPQICNADGQWQSGSACPYLCSQGNCTGECTPGAKRCYQGTTPQTCSTQGLWVSGTPTMRQLILNSDFESGRNVNWVEASTAGENIVDRWTILFPNRPGSLPPLVYAGAYSAWLGGVDSSRDHLYQTVAIPPGTTGLTLAFRYYVETDDSLTVAYDYMYVSIGPPAPSTGIGLPPPGALQIVSFTNRDASSNAWRLFNGVIPGNWSGQTVELRFRSESDVSDITNFLVDNVELTATVCE